MSFPNIFEQSNADKVIERIEKLKPDSQPEWGKMNVAQMLAHCNVQYEFMLEDKHPKVGAFKKFLLRLFVKPIVTGTKAYPKNSRTAKEFLVAAEQDFNLQKERLIGYINHCVQLGKKHFEGAESPTLGRLTADEINTMFYKHLDHHLRQFSV